MAARTKSRGWMFSLLTCVAILIVGLILVDHWQGGPLGREFHAYGGVEGADIQVGEHMLLGEGAGVVNSTSLPFRIAAVRPVDGSPSAALEAGIVTVGAGQPVPGVVQADSSLYPFTSGATEIPAGTGSNSGQQYALALLVDGKRPGSFQVHGLLVTYHWGPFTYTTELPETFTVTITQP